MATIRRSITLTDQEDEWIGDQIKAGRCTNESEYIGDLIDRDRERCAELEALRATVQEALDSGVGDKARDALIMEEIQAQLRGHGRR